MGLAPRNAPSLIREHTNFVAFGFRLEARQLLPLGKPSRQQWIECLHYLMMLERHVQLWLGDLMVYGEAQWGEVAVRQMVTTTRYDYESLRNFKWVASSVDISRRCHTLSFSHHEAVADLSPSQQQQVLDQAEQHSWTRDQTRQEAWRIKHAVAHSQQFMLDPHLRLGDCRHLIAELPDTSIDLLITDPPYGISYESPLRLVPFPRMANDNQRAATLLDETFRCVMPKLTPSAPACVFTSRKTLREMISVLAQYFPLCRALTWGKQAWGVGDCQGNYGDQYELMILAHNGTRGLTTSAIHCDRVGTNQLLHPTQKPVALLRSIIEMWTDPGDTILDPFMGSASTCLAARACGRQYIGMEIERQWYEVALQRMAGAMEDWEQDAPH